MSERPFDIAIIGAGPIGLFAAFYAGLRDMKTLVVDSLDSPGGQLTALYPEKPVYDMPGFPEILAKDLSSEMVRQASRFAPHFAFGERCTTLEKAGEQFSLNTDKASYRTNTVLICAGLGSFTPTKIGVATEAEFAGKGLSYGVLDPELHRGKRVVIVGGGDSALDWVHGLLGIASSVTLVHRRDKFRAHEESVKLMYASDAVVRTFETVEEIVGKDTVQAVVTKNSKDERTHRVECDSVIVCIGYKSDLGPIRGWGIEMEKNKIVVSQRMETNITGVFAAGDVCTHAAKLDLIATGVGEACIAVNFAKTLIDPTAKAFPGHSSDMKLPDLK